MKVRVVVMTIPDYDATAGATRSMCKAVNGKQLNDPKKLAQALLEIVNAKKPPFRLTLGSDAVDVLENKLASVNRELDQWRELSVSMAVK